MTMAMVHVAILGYQHRLASELCQRLGYPVSARYLGVIQAANAVVEVRTKVPGTDVCAVPSTVPHT